MRTRNPKLKNEIYDFVSTFYRESLKAPSFQEIADNFKISKSTAYYYIMEMNKEGTVSYRDGVITITTSEKLNPLVSGYPILGSIACGDPTSEEENIEEYIPLPEAIFGKGDLYILRAVGDSMEDAGISNGDLVVVDKNAIPKVGSIVVALDENNENTLKKFEGIKNGKAILSYMNETIYPGKKILVDELVCQGVAKHVIKALE